MARGSFIKAAEDLVPGDVVIEPRLVLVQGRWATQDWLRIVTGVSIKTHAVDVTFMDGMTSPWMIGADIEVAG